MSDKWAWFQGLGVVWTAALVIAFVLLGAIEYPFFVSYPGLQLFLREVAFALIISSVFGLTIERVQRKEFIRLVTEEREVLKRDVFLYAYGSNLPDQIRQEMRSSILNQPFYRQDLVIDWEFSPIHDKPELMDVKKRYSYTVVNNSQDSRDWHFSFVQIGADDLQAVADAKFGCLRITRKNQTTTEFQGAHLTTECPTNQPHTKKMSMGIKLDPEESVGIYYEVAHIRKMYGDDKYNSKESVVGTTKVRLRFPENFEVQVACKTKPLKAAADHDPPTRYSLEWAEGMLPFTGVTISWSRKEEAIGESQVRTG